MGVEAVLFGQAIGKQRGAPLAVLAESFNTGVFAAWERGRGRWAWGAAGRVFFLDGKESAIGKELDAQALASYRLAGASRVGLFAQVLAGPSILFPAVGSTSVGMNAGTGLFARWSRKKAVKFAGKSKARFGVAVGLTYRASAYKPKGFNYALFHRVATDLALNLGF